MKMLLRLFITAFNIGLFIFVNGQSVVQLIQYADQKFDNGHFRLAAKEYQRALFFGPKDGVGLLNVRTGDCYFEMDSFATAVRYYRFASTLISNDSLRTEAVFKKAVCNMLIHKNQLAIFDLLNLNTASLPDISKKQKLLLAIAYFGTEAFDKAEKYFVESIFDENDDIQPLIHTLFQQKKLNRPNPSLAYWLSVVIPGTGQFYAGDFKNGINSMGLSVGLMYLAYRLMLANGIWDAIFTILPWWQRYYMGGYNSARKIAVAKRDVNRAEIYHKIYKLVQNN